MSLPFLGSTSGLTPQRLRGRSYQHLSRDLYVAAHAQLDLRTRTSATLLVFPGSAACLITAAVLQQLPVDDDGIVHVARDVHAPRSERSGVKVHRCPVEEDERLDLDGIPVTDGPRTFVDLARRLDLEALVAVGDVVLRRYQPDELQAALDRRPRRPGLPRARLAAALADPGADSPAETRARLRLHAAGFLAMRHGVVVRDAAGGWLAEPDLADEQARVAVQHDGLVHVLGSPRARRQDLQRDELTRQADWQVVVATALDDQRPHLLLDKVADAYRRSARLWGAHVLPPHLR